MSRRLLAACCLVVLLGGCAQAQDALDQARGTVEEGLQRLEWCTAAFRLGAAVEARDAEAARAAGADLQDNAPEELQDDLTVVLDALARAEAGEPEALASDEVRDAGQRVLETARSQCDPTTRPE